MSLSSASHNYDDLLKGFIEQVVPETTAYKNNLLAGYSRALHNHFPTICKLLGESVFFALARVYAQHFPSHSWDINIYGDQFSEFIRAQQQGPRGADFEWYTIAWLADVEYTLLCLYYDDSDQSQVRVDMSSQNSLDRQKAFSLMDNLIGCHPWLSFYNENNKLENGKFENKNNKLKYSESQLFDNSRFVLTAIRCLDASGFNVTLQINPITAN